MHLPVFAALLLAACAHARTATRVPAVGAAITGLNDKDARHKAMVHPAFANAGQRAGLEVWRIEDFNPVLVPQNDVGKFYKGDSYIVLKTTADKRNNLSWDIHYWIGSQSTQDEAGAAAILTVGLDDKFGGAAIQHRETLGHESQQFLGYFRPAIRYLDGGHASGFSHVTTNAGAEKRLFQIKGKRNVRVRQVDPLISSMNKGDCFILDKDHDIYVYVGEKAKNVEKLKAISVANQIRDQDHNGRGRVEILDQYSSDVDIQKFFTALGSGSKDIVPEESAGGDDQTFERSEEQSVILSEISDSTGSLKITPLPKPFRQEQLKPADCYILDTVSGSIYVWVGKQSTQREKTEAMSKAQQYLSAKNYPSWVHVSKIPQGTEPAAFKQYFATWRDTGMAHNRLVRSISASQDTLIGGKASDMDDGVKMFRLYGTSASYMRVQQVAEQTTSLQPDDVFLLLTPKKVYIWHGQSSSAVEQEQAMLFLPAFPGAVRQHEVIKQGSEPDDFWSYLTGDASQVSTTEAVKERVTKPVRSRLFKVDLKSDNTISFDEIVDFKQQDLHDDEVYVLDSDNGMFVWLGENTSPQMKKLHFRITRAYHYVGTYAVFKQGFEFELFKSAFDDWDPQMWLKKRQEDSIESNDV